MTLSHDDRLRFGVCWYPDHWPEARWDRDLRLMKDMGLECIRWGEGSWTLFEPTEDHFDFSMVHRILDLCAAHDLGVILGTPTYAPPAWMEERYPEIIAKRADGTRWHRHSRRMYDYTAPAYRERCRSIVSAMAEHFARDPRVWAWQLDNEIWCHLDELWGDSVLHAFHDWLTRRYNGDIAELNHAWGLAFWSNQLERFAQADLPGPTPANRNPHQVADYLRFLSDTAIDFIGGQARIIHAVHPAAQVLHNCPFDPIDRAGLLHGLDIYGHDHYPAFAGGFAGRPAAGLGFSRYRAYARRLWVVEQESSQDGNVSVRLPTNAPGELAVSAIQSIAHGANLVAFFRWRSFPAAQEITWGGLLPHWGEPGRHYDEAKALIATLKPIAPVIAATTPEVTVARLYGFDQWLAHKAEPWMADAIGNPEDGGAALRRLGLNEDHLRPGDLLDRKGYVVALLPYATSISDNAARRLTQWVAAGGTLVVGPLAGHRDTNGHGPWNGEPPGNLGALTGTSNCETTTWVGKLLIHGSDGDTTLPVGKYAEVLEPRGHDVQVRATYGSGWLAGKPAITERSAGAGRVIHCGVPLTGPVIEWLWDQLALPRPHMVCAVHEPGAEVISRVGPGYRLHFCLNHSPTPVVVWVGQALSDPVTGEVLRHSFTLAGHSWRLLREDIDSAPSAPSAAS